MKTPPQSLLYWIGLTALVSLFIGAIAWSLIPLHGHTLPHWLAQTWDIQFRVAALLSSLACALLAVGTMSLSLLAPAGQTRQHDERAKH